MWAVFLLIVGLVTVPLGAELLVRGAARLAAIVGISPLVVGLTVVAYGTSSPELAVCVYSGLTGSADIAVGNAVGSNICNVLLILGLSALIRPLAISRSLVRGEVPLVIATSVLLLLMAWDGNVGRLDGGVLFAGCLLYTVWSIRLSRKKKQAEPMPGAARAIGESARRPAWPAQVGLVVAGLAVLVLGSHWLVQGAVAIAEAMGISKLVIGLTVIAIGTSLPELATSVVACMRGQPDLAVGNAIGSNLFNVLLVIGLTAVVAPAGVEVDPVALRFDIPIMIAVSIACLPVFLTGASISRWEGAFFLIYYAAYTGFLVLRADQRDELTATDTLMMAFAVPMLVVTGLVIAQRLLRRARTGASAKRL